MPRAVDSIRERAKELAPWLTEVRRELHRHPELAWEERETTARLRRWLSEAGVDLVDLGLPTGLVAEVRGERPGPIVALRTDIDALPVTEETGLEYASRASGKMHACGHDFHMAVMLGATHILSRLRGELSGTVRILFQPAEETATGANALIQAGALDGVRSIFGLHNKPDLPAGHVGIRPGPLMAAADTIEISIRGKGGHAAMPDATVDPIVAGSAVVMALQAVVSRNVSPLEAAVVSICSFQAGAAHNVIPPSATLLGTVRTFDPTLRERLPALLGRIVHEVAAGYGADAELRFSLGPPAVRNDPALCKVMAQAAADLSIPVVEAHPTMGGEDFAEYQQRVPGCLIWLGTGCREGWHHPRFMVDEAVIPTGAALLARAAMLCL